MQQQTERHRYAEVDISAKVRSVAGEFRVSQEQLGHVLGFQRMAVVRRLNGTTQWSARELAVLADHFGVPIARFYGDAA